MFGYKMSLKKICEMLFSLQSDHVGHMAILRT